MNGAELSDIPILNRPVLCDPEVLKLLEAVLADAKAGRVIGLAVSVARGGGQFTGHCAGADIAAMNMGLDSVKAFLLQASHRGSSGLVAARR